MGDPRRLKKKYKRPRSPFEKTRIDSELEYLGKYGLRNKTELWKHKFALGKYRQRARLLVTMPEHAKQIANSELVGRLNRMGIVSKNATTDDVLSLSIESLLDRRLQTFVFKLGLARSMFQARQLIAHKHISVSGKLISSPSYMVLLRDEKEIKYSENSPFVNNKDKLMSSKKRSDDGHDRPPRKRTSKKSSRNRRE